VIRVLALTRYDATGASSRIRCLQYRPALRAAGVDVEPSPLLGAWYLEALYEGRRPAWRQVLRAYADRARALFSSHTYDLIWIEYELFPWLPAFVERALLSGPTPYVVEYDDAVFHRYDRHRRRAVRWALGTKLDGLMRRAATVIAGNEYLADRARASGAPTVTVLPSVVDLERYVVPPRRDEPAGARPGGFTVGWIGSPTTSRYLEDVAPPLGELVRTGALRLVTVGAAPGVLAKVPHEAHPWREASEVDEIGAFDAGIMPMPDTPWTRGKCGYKLIQYMACGVPVIASPVGVNRTIVEPGVSGFIASTPRDWVEALTALRDDPGRRIRMGEAGRARVEREYSLQVNAPRLAALLRDAAGRR
jgi:glycosyltransferase involved in cell wall biosynthesis